MLHDLTKNAKGSTGGRALVNKIKMLLDGDWNVHIHHIDREANACADALANLGCEGSFNMTMYKQPPAFLGQLLLADRMGVSTPRSILM